ncbi:hypothetical protein DICPUDRAFT_150216 [Dictyostelium purpureum]|uniref:ER membrane protein complex subunit 3 n=1 Tax=Dictyostelium purpureum TaxID=5786 RepID=F0ZFR6_DICPU|nr:uncharacterized protein DICPUDRAFT_150216 [Dictyostelium purpureum]EGC37221.1 hypothetical protein DICPUDRAFT_150216 [Dictyostelium purpureum]|eukprot:XP_003286272.1 hypothetical protein DICPUDRAFT_150216 [Dictyostelium purpureum]
MIEAPIVLDVEIRNWVVIPILIVLFIVSALKLNFSRILQLKSNRDQDVEKTMQMQTINRVRRLTSFYNRIPQKSFFMRKAFLCGTPGATNPKNRGLLSSIAPAQEDSNPMNMMFANSMFTDPSGMTDMLKGNVVHLVPQITMMSWVNHFFSGFVACKLPFFPLTIRFKAFLQRGIELSSLDVSYVSSLSWYFLCWFGSEGINNILLSDNFVSPDTQLFNSQVEPGPPAQQNPIHKIYDGERENIEMIRYDSIMNNIENRFLDNLSKKTSLDLNTLNNLNNSNNNNNNNNNTLTKIQKTKTKSSSSSSSSTNTKRVLYQKPSLK